MNIPRLVQLCTLPVISRFAISHGLLNISLSCTEYNSAAVCVIFLLAVICKLTLIATGIRHYIPALNGIINQMNKQTERGKKKRWCFWKGASQSDAAESPSLRNYFSFSARAVFYFSLGLCQNHKNKPWCYSKPLNFCCLFCLLFNSTVTPNSGSIWQAVATLERAFAVCTLPRLGRCSLNVRPVWLNIS